MPHRDFSFRSAPRGDEETTFSITVLDENDNAISDETFRLLDYVPLNALVTLNVALRSGRIIGNAASVEFVRTMIVSDDEPRWINLISDKRLRIAAEQLEELVTWLLETVAERPTGPPSGSPDGRSQNGDSSMVAVPSEG